MKKFKKASDSQVSITELMLPAHSNFSGKIHGGHILNLMDQVAFACASKHSGAYCVTASVNKVDFLNPVEVGELLTIKASVNYTGNTSMVVGMRVESENVREGYVRHCNSSYFTMVAKNDDGTNKSIPGLILDTPESIRRFTRSVQRQEHGKLRESQFGSEDDFNVGKHLEMLGGHNVKVETQ